MSNRKDTEREQLIDQCERLYVMGFRKPYQIMKMLKIGDFTTAERYLNIAMRRLHRRFNMNKPVNKEKEMQDQLMTIDRGIQELWAAYLVANGTSEQTGAINGIERLMKNKAELLGLEAPKEFLLGGKKETLWEVLQKMPENEREQIIKQIAIYTDGGQKPA